MNICGFLNWIVVVVFAMLLVGCASAPPMNVMMVNPQTGQAINIHHESWGYGVKGMAASLGAQEAQRKAIAGAKAMGYTEVREVK